MKDNNLFRIALLIILVGFLFVYYQNSQIGRYQFRDESHRTVIDTKTGKVYSTGKLQFSIKN